MAVLLNFDADSVVLEHKLPASPVKPQECATERSDED